MAHLRDIEADCDWSGCTSRATVALHNRHNALVGRFCRGHGEQRLRSLRGGEEKADRKAAS